MDDVERRFMKVKISKASGPDYIPNRVLCDFAECLAKPLCAIFNVSFCEAYVPSLTKSADLVSLPKVNTPPPPRDWKKICTRYLSPLYLVKSRSPLCVKWIWDNVGVDVDPTHYGCKRGTSTVHALVELYHLWSKAKYECRLKQYVRILLLVFSKAFNHIDHTILITKLRTIYHLPKSIGAWITAFLTDRHQHVKIEQQVSDWLHIQEGFTQGTLLGWYFSP